MNFVQLARHLLSIIEDEEDKIVIKRMVQRLNLDDTDTLETVNEKIKDASKNEADIIYLESKYRHFKVRKMRELERIEDNFVLGMSNLYEGRKNTKVVTDALIRTDDSYMRVREELDTLELLHGTLINMIRYIFSQDYKHVELSVNYRRELRADERSE